MDTFAAPVASLPEPPRLHWGWVMLLSVITLGLFSGIWLIVQCQWMRQVRGRSRALPWAIVYAVAWTIRLVIVTSPTAMHALNVPPEVAFYRLALRLVVALFWLVAVFKLRAELGESPIDLDLSDGMTFFFGTWYLQYHLSKYDVRRAGAQQASLA